LESGASASGFQDGWQIKRREEMKIKFRITEPFFITPVLAIYQGIQIAWLWFEVDFIIRK